MKVLIAVDDRAIASRIADFVTRHNWTPASDFKVLTVVEPLLVGSYMSVFPAPMLSELRQDMLSKGKELVRYVALALRDSFNSTRIEEEVLEGNPKESIVRCARDWGADVIVVGSHGRHGLERLMLGSVSMAVASTAPCSVIVVRPDFLKHAEDECAHEQVSQVKELVP